MKKIVLGLAGLAIAGAVGFFVLTAPATYDLVRSDGKFTATGQRSLDNGKTLFNAGGCPACHAVPGQQDRLKIAGGMGLKSPFGTFYVPNITPHPRDGIGAWTETDFIRAMREGVSPDGSHYYPAFPYTSYQRMSPNDLADMFAYIKTLAPVEGRVRDHDLPFPVNLRRGLGLWKLAFLDGQQFQPDPSKSAEWNRGAYLVNGPGHCAECHSPRELWGAIKSGMRFAGGPNPEGEGWVPNITQDGNGLKSWSKADIAELLKTGFTPEFDSVGGTMTAVVRNMSQLTDADRAAMADYLKALPAIPSPPKPKKAE